MLVGSFLAVVAAGDFVLEYTLSHCRARKQRTRAMSIVEFILCNFFRRWILLSLWASVARFVLTGKHAQQVQRSRRAATPDRIEYVLWKQGWRRFVKQKARYWNFVIIHTCFRPGNLTNNFGRFIFNNSSLCHFKIPLIKKKMLLITKQVRHCSQSMMKKRLHAMRAYYYISYSSRCASTSKD